MRIQETNQILKEGKIDRLDHERREREQEESGGLRNRFRAMTGTLGRLIRRSDVWAGLGAAAVALVATAGAVMRSRQKKRAWYQFGR